MKKKRKSQQRQRKYKESMDFFRIEKYNTKTKKINRWSQQQNGENKESVSLKREQ